MIPPHDLFVWKMSLVVFICDQTLWNICTKLSCSSSWILSETCCSCFLVLTLWRFGRLRETATSVLTISGQVRCFVQVMDCVNALLILWWSIFIPGIQKVWCISWTKVVFFPFNKINFPPTHTTFFLLICFLASSLLAVYITSSGVFPPPSQKKTKGMHHLNGKCKYEWQLTWLCALLSNLHTILCITQKLDYWLHVKWVGPLRLAFFVPQLFIKGLFQVLHWKKTFKCLLFLWSSYLFFLKPSASSMKKMAENPGYHFT